MPLNTSLIQAICFDIDGTLSDTDDLWLQKTLPLVQPFQRIFPKMEPSIITRRLIMGLETPGNYMYYLLDCMGLDGFAGMIYNWINRSVFHPRAKKYLIVPGVKQTLETLEHRFPMAVVSARDHAGTIGFLQTFDLDPHFRVIATSQTCQYTKPFPHPILWAAAQMGVKPENCLMVGDTSVDIRAGKAAGAQTVGVLCGFGKEKELRRAGADLILNSPLDLLASLGLTSN
jgi:N-acetyl-D-muramate 6-phosphate phosphatase